MFQVHKKAVQLTVITTVLVVAFICLIEAFTNISLLGMIMIKVVGLSIPVIFYFEFFNLGYTFNQAFSLKRDHEQLKTSFFMGLASLVIMAGCYYIFRSDLFVSLVKNAFGGQGVTKGLFFLILLLTLVLSAVEELFFRGLIFLNLYTKEKIVQAYLLSCALSVFYYYIALFQVLPKGSTLGFCLMMGVISALLCFVNTWKENLYHSLFMHVFGSISLGTIAYLTLF